MTDRRMRLDEAIDRAVREMVRRDPPAGLRRRVLRRLHAPARRATGWRPLATAAAAFGGIAIVALVVRDAPPPASAPPRAAVAVPAAAPPAPALTMELPASPAARTVSREPMQPARRREPERVATFAPPDGRISAANVSSVRPSGTVTSSAAPADARPRYAAVPVASPVPGLPPIVVPALTPPVPLEIPPIVIVPLHAPKVQQAPSPPR